MKMNDRKGRIYHERWRGNGFHQEPRTLNKSIYYLSRFYITAICIIYVHFKKQELCSRQLHAAIVMNKER